MKEAKIIGMFWIVYTIVCLSYQTGLMDFTIGMLIGLAYTIAYLSISLAMIKMRRKTPIATKPMPKTVVIDFSPMIEGFENVFKPDFGRIEYDLD